MNPVILPNVASFLVTEDCNLRCTYCFEKHKPNHMTKEVARKALEYLCDNAIRAGEDYFSAMLFGGEPLMNVDIVEEILEYGVALGKKKGIRFTASMVTNATIMNERIKNLFMKYKDLADLSVQLSADGIKEIHDRYRITVGGKGSFDAIEKNVPIWKEIFADNLDRLNVHGCSNHDTLPFLFENYRFFREVWKVPRIWFLPIHSETWSDDDVRIYEEQLGKIADYILNEVKKTGRIDEVMYYAPIDRCLSCDAFPSAPCGAGKNFVTITASGEIYPCHQVYFNDPQKLTKIGDIWNGMDEMRRKFFLAYDNDDLDCKKMNPDCDAYACYRCIAENYLQNGSFLAQTDCLGNRCKMSQVERKIQVKIRKELETMGLLHPENQRMGNNPNNPACLCDCRGSSCENGLLETDTEVIALALKTILDKLDTLDKGQQYLLKKVLEAGE